MWQFRVKTRPVRSCARPDHGLRSKKVRIIQRSRPDEGQVRPRFGYAEKGCAALWAKAAAHLVATVSDTLVPTDFALACDLLCWEADIDRP